MFHGWDRRSYMDWTHNCNFELQNHGRGFTKVIPVMSRFFLVFFFFFFIIIFLTVLRRLLCRSFLCFAFIPFVANRYWSLTFTSSQCVFFFLYFTMMIHSWARRRSYVDRTHTCKVELHLNYEKGSASVTLFQPAVLFWWPFQGAPLIYMSFVFISVIAKGLFSFAVQCN